MNGPEEVFGRPDAVEFFKNEMTLVVVLDVQAVASGRWARGRRAFEKERAPPHGIPFQLPVPDDGSAPQVWEDENSLQGRCARSDCHDRYRDLCGGEVNLSLNALPHEKHLDWMRSSPLAQREEGSYLSHFQT